MLWIIIAIVYVAIGVGILLWVVSNDPWGGLALYFWWLVVFFYPFLYIRSLFEK